MVIADRFSRFWSQTKIKLFFSIIYFTFVIIMINTYYVMEPKFVVSEAFSAAWKGVKSQLWILAGLLIGYSILSFTINAVVPAVVESRFVAWLIALLISSLFTLGYTKNLFQALDGEEPQFSAYGRQATNIITYLLASIILCFTIGVGLLFFIIPGIYLGIRLQFYLAFIVEERAGVFEALNKSWEITRGQFTPLFLLFLMSCGIFLLGCILLGIGVFVALPVIGMAYAYAFRKLNIPTQQPE